MIVQKIQFFVDNSEKAQIDSSGRLLLGTTTEGQSSADDLTIEGSGNTGITIRSGTSNTGNLYFSDGTSSTAEYQGFIEYDHSANHLRFGTGASERVRIHSGGQVQIAGDSTASISSFADDLIIGESGSSAINGITLCSTDSSGIRFHDTADMGEIEFDHSDNSLAIKANSILKFRTNNAERLRIDSSGRHLFTNVASPNTSGYGYNEWDPKTQILETQGLAIQRCYDGTWGGGLILASSRGSYSSPSAVQSGDRAGGIYFCSHDGTDFRNYSAAIEGIVDDSVASNDTPGKLSFQVAADGSNQLTERMSISKEGYVRNPDRPAFDVTVSNGAISSGNTIVFNEADLNNGNHYNNSNGKFTAPITGTYFFYFGGIKDNTTGVARMKLLKNDGSYVHNREFRLDDGDSYGENASMSIICSLNSGNTVEVRVTEGTIYGSSDGYTYFGGYLLS